MQKTIWLGMVLLLLVVTMAGPAPAAQKKAGLPDVVIFVTTSMGSTSYGRAVAQSDLLQSKLKITFTPEPTTGVLAQGNLIKAGRALLMATNPLRVGTISMRLAVVAYLIPFMFAYNPGLLLIGEPGPVIFSAVKAVIAILALAAGIEGYCYFAGRLNAYQRVLFVVSGLGLISPGLVLDFIGLMAGIVAFVWTKASMPTSQKVVENI